MSTRDDKKNFTFRVGGVGSSGTFRSPRPLSTRGAWARAGSGLGGQGVGEQGRVEPKAVLRRRRNLAEPFYIPSIVELLFVLSDLHCERSNEGDVIDSEITFPTVVIFLIL